MRPAVPPAKIVLRANTRKLMHDVARYGVLARGSRIREADLRMRRCEARRAGAVGCSVGRNMLEHPSPRAMTAAISRESRDGWIPDQAHEEPVAAAKDWSSGDTDDE